MSQSQGLGRLVLGKELARLADGADALAMTHSSKLGGPQVRVKDLSP